MLVLGGLAVSLSSTLCWTWRKGKGWWTSITASGSCGPGEWTWCKRRYDTSCQSLSVLWLGPQGLSWLPTSQSQGEEKHCKFPPRNSLGKKMIYLAICFLPSLLSFLSSSFCFSFHKQTKKRPGVSQVTQPWTSICLCFWVNEPCRISTHVKTSGLQYHFCVLCLLNQLVTKTRPLLRIARYFSCGSRVLSVHFVLLLCRNSLTSWEFARFAEALCSN